MHLVQIRVTYYIRKIQKWKQDVLYLATRVLSDPAHYCMRVPQKQRKTFYFDSLFEFSSLTELHALFSLGVYMPLIVPSTEPTWRNTCLFVCCIVSQGLCHMCPFLPCYTSFICIPEGFCQSLINWYQLDMNWQWYINSSNGEMCQRISNVCVWIDWFIKLVNIKW